MKRSYGWRWSALALILTLSLAQSAFAKPKIQMAILLDGSGSMQGLIDQTKNQIWKIVNALQAATKDGVTPELEVALFEHGKQNLPKEAGYLQRLVPLSTELDLVSDKLFAITARGSQEFTGWAIQAATQELNWSESPENFRVIFIAGNETMKQGPVDHKGAIQAAVDQGIIVNTIHAGTEQAGTRDLWKDAADIGLGRFVNIDHNLKAPFIKSPHDLTLLKLNEKLNETYIPYGPRGLEYKERQLKADKDAGEHLVSRSITKGGAYYRSASWDLVDALAEKTVKLEDVKDEHLPEVMRSMSFQEKLTYLKKMAEARKRLRTAIVEVGKLRKEFVDEKLKELIEEHGQTVEAAMVEILKEQLTAKGFKLES